MVFPDSSILATLQSSASPPTDANDNSITERRIHNFIKSPSKKHANRTPSEKNQTKSNQI